jgi:CheY-like chemotaxis protein/anti-sigma regulatory factor (Ser/Thr protein kinase)
MSQTIIAIDDEPYNLLLIENYLEGTGYDLKCFASGIEALAFLRSNGAGAVDAILLDRMMPGMDGLTFMHELRTLEDHASVPVIVQTVAVSSAEIAEGIAAGAYYYLTKPYGREVLTAIVARALDDFGFHKGLKKTVALMTEALGYVQAMRFSFRTFDEVRVISFFLASLFPDQVSARLGITELMLNAIEHGNLGITYAEKSDLIHRGEWHSEVERRLEMPEYRERRAQAYFERSGNALAVTIEDMGTGFDWQAYSGREPTRALDSNGRGIVVSRMVSFDEVTYIAPGNKVVCRKNVQ